jgi:tripartite-type tricarboxylate transporter receptor subunit TctC
MMRRLTIALYLISIIYIFGLGASIVQAQPYPNRPIQLVIPMIPGSPLDIPGRLFAEELGKVLGTQVVVLNKPGASATLGTDAVVRSKKDGYTLVYTNASAIVFTRVTHPETVPYDPVKDLEPLGVHLFLPLTVTVLESSPWKNYTDLVDYAKKNPGKLRVCTHGQGTVDHFNLEITQSLTGAQFTHVPFKGGQTITAAMLGEHVEATYTAISSVLPFVNSGQMRILLLSKKLPEIPKIPTLSELGYTQDLFSPWFALYAPAGLPEEVKKVLVPAIEKAVNHPESKAKINSMGFMVDYKSPEELRKLMREYYERANAIALKIGLRK